MSRTSHPPAGDVERTTRGGCDGTHALHETVGSGASRSDLAGCARPLPKTLEDLVSFRAFANFIKEFIPSFHKHDKLLRPYAKKGARFKDYEADPEAQQAFKSLKEAV